MNCPASEQNRKSTGKKKKIKLLWIDKYVIKAIYSANMPPEQVSCHPVIWRNCRGQQLGSLSGCLATRNRVEITELFSDHGLQDKWSQIP